MRLLLVGAHLPLIGNNKQQLGKCVFNSQNFNCIENIHSPGYLHLQLVSRCITSASLNYLKTARVKPWTHRDENDKSPVGAAGSEAPMPGPDLHPQLISILTEFKGYFVILNGQIEHLIPSSRVVRRLGTTAAL